MRGEYEFAFEFWYCGPSVKHQIGGEKEGASNEKSWLVIISKSSENPMGLSMYAGSIETVEYIWVNIWCMLDWILSGVRQIASSKSQSMRGASHQPAYMGSCLTITHKCLPCLPSRWVSLRGISDLPRAEWWMMVNSAEDWYLFYLGYLLP